MRHTIHSKALSIVCYRWNLLINTHVVEQVCAHYYKHLSYHFTGVRGRTPQASPCLIASVSFQNLPVLSLKLLQIGIDYCAEHSHPVSYENDGHV